MCKHNDDLKPRASSTVSKPSQHTQFPVNTSSPSCAKAASGPRMMRRGSTGYVHRSKARRQSGAAVVGIHHAGEDFLKLNEVIMERTDSIKLLKKYQEEEEGDEQKQEAQAPHPAGDANPDPLKRIYRRKPRRMSGCVASMEDIKVDLPSLLQRENSVHLIKKRMPSRRASITY